MKQKRKKIKLSTGLPHDVGLKSRKKILIDYAKIKGVFLPENNPKIKKNPQKSRI